jgi:hypothetical protein
MSDLKTWVHREGKCNREMVFLDPTSYFDTSCTSQGAEAYHNSFYGHVAIWKIRIRPVPGANLDTKRVGLLLLQSGSGLGETQLANFYVVRDDGTEEWQVNRHWSSVGGDSRPSQSASFILWYQDGVGHTYYNDNDGEFYKVIW